MLFLTYRYVNLSRKRVDVSEKNSIWSAARLHPDLTTADVSIIIMSGQEMNDFEFQLQAERLHVEQGTEGGWNKQQTYTDPSDGTVYEWDAERKGWFPKVGSNWCAARPA